MQISVRVLMSSGLGFSAGFKLGFTVLRGRPRCFLGQGEELSGFIVDNEVKESEGVRLGDVHIGIWRILCFRGDREGVVYNLEVVIGREGN